MNHSVASPLPGLLASPIRATLIALFLVGCAGKSELPISAGSGDAPTLPAPQHPTVPTVKVAPAVGWRDGEAPRPAGNLAVSAFARELDHPRWLYRLPNGDILVAETNAPVRPDDRRGFKAAVMKYFMKSAGAGVPSADRITLLRDADRDGIAEIRGPFLQRLHSPFGMALIGDTLYVANTDAIWAFPYRSGATAIDDAGRKVIDLPAGTLNHHWTKNLLPSPDGTRLYVTVGSNSNVAENGIEAEAQRAAILEVELATHRSRVFATGLRNPNGLAWHDDVLWTVVNERDELGNDLVPDYLTSVMDGGFYGWPYSYYGQHVDDRVQPPRPDLVATARVPDYALGAHTASLGLAFSPGNAFDADYASGAFISQHGSWNRNPPSGYRVVFVSFEGGRPVGIPKDVLDGFLNERGEARGRPVGLAFDMSDALLVADDVGNCIWRVTRKSPE